MSGRCCHKPWPCVDRLTLGLAVVATLIGISGCQLVPTDDSAEGPELTAREDVQAAPLKAELWAETPLVVDEVLPGNEPTLEARTELPERRVVETPKEPVSQYPENLIKGIADPEEIKEVNLNFDAIQMTELVEAFAQLLQFSYLVDPAVANKGAVTINVQAEMTAREAWETFEHILWLSGAYASRNPGFIHILPFDKMPKERRLLFSHDTLANVEVVLLQIRYRKSSEIVGLLEPFKTDGATVKDLPESNTLLIVEAPANMPKMRELIKQLDNKGEAAWPHICFPCRNIDAEELADELKSLLPVLGFAVTEKGPSGGMVKITSLPRLQCVVVSAAMQDVLDEVERWIRALDTTDMMEKENIYWYNVKHSTAEQLREVLEVFFNTEATTGTRPSRTKGTSSKAGATTGSTDEARTTTPTSASTARKTTTRSSSSGQDAGKSGTIFDTPVVVLVDAVRERLTIKTTQRAYSLIEALLERQDVAPRQVSIQAIIAEVILTKSTEYGFSYTAQKLLATGSDSMSVGEDNVRNIVGMTSAGAGAIPGDIASQNFAFLFTGKRGDPLAFITAVAGKSNTKVLSEPQVVVLSGEAATINVGEKVPIPTESTNYSGSADNFRTNYDYEDTGVIMDVTPYVTAGNDVRIEVRQEVSDAAASEDPTIPPRITNKIVESVLSVPDGGTVMMGGLIRTKRTTSKTGWPFLMDIPWVGGLFRTNRTTDDRSELLILIKVNVISNESQMDHLIRRYEEALAEIREQDKGGYR